ncbi:vWA domain-containing protein [Cohnella massiliensis]|uniref:vWA domain-containing protein n=1 Tax=Cohnella massiliensis TaxID=1816691 RepID=UPI0009B9B071|nr:VWA domain-containing protein [Cohnella massiliensis]
MGFQSLAGIGFAASLPLIVLLYLLKRTYVDTPVPSSLLWRRALREQEANRPWQKLRRRLLLLLQLLAAALLTLALMGPYASGTSGSARPVAVVLDTSASMTAVSPEGDGAQSALQLAKLRIAEWLAEQPGARPVTLIAAGDQPVVLASAQRDREALEAALEAARPNYGRADLAAALSLADATLRGEAEGEIWLLTDGKARQQVEASAAGEVTANPLRVTEIDSGRANVSIAAFGVRGEAGTDTAAAVVTLMNRGLEPLSGTLAVRAEGVPEPAEESATFALEAGEQRSFRFDRLPAAEFYMATLGRIDGYAADNTAYAFSAAQAAGRALLVGEGNLFLEKALQLAGVQVVRADPAGFEPDGTIADTVDWVVLDGADEETLASDEWRKLIGSKPVWRIWSAETPPAGGEAVAPANGEAEVGDHPVVRYLTFGDVHISRLVKPAPGSPAFGDPVVTYGGVPAVYAGMTDGKPGLVFAFGLQDSDLPLRTEFPILIAQASEWMGGGSSANLGQAVAGSQLDVQFVSEAADARWKAIAAEEGVPTTEQETTAIARTPEGGLSGLQTAPPVPGLYRLSILDASGRELAGPLLAVAADPAESMAAHGSETETGGQPATENEAPAAADEVAILEDRTSFVPWIAAVLLLLLALEWGVYRRGTVV